MLNQIPKGAKDRKHRRHKTQNNDKEVMFLKHDIDSEATVRTLLVYCSHGAFPLALKQLRYSSALKRVAYPTRSIPRRALAAGRRAQARGGRHTRLLPSPITLAGSSTAKPPPCQRTWAASELWARPRCCLCAAPRLTFADPRLPRVVSRAARTRRGPRPSSG